MGKINEFVIWSDDCLDYERDWKKDLEAEYPYSSEEERIRLMYETNFDTLQIERMNLNITMNGPIIVIADLGLWNGRRSGYKMIESGIIGDCLSVNADSARWYVDKLGDLRCTAIHHDGANYYLYRAFKAGYTEAQVALLQRKVYDDDFSRSDITRYTERLGDTIADVYGIEIRRKKTPVSA